MTDDVFDGDYTDFSEVNCQPINDMDFTNYQVVAVGYNIDTANPENSYIEFKRPKV